MDETVQSNDINSVNSDVKTSTLGSRHEQDVDDQNQEMTGWLMKRTKISHKWKKQWFHLKKTDLYYGDSSENAVKMIPLRSAEIAETNIDKKSNAFRIKPKDSKRTYYIHAEDENTQHNWMQAICFAKAAGRTGDESSACVIQ